MVFRFLSGLFIFGAYYFLFGVAVLEKLIEWFKKPIVLSRRELLVNDLILFTSLFVLLLVF